MRYLGLNEMLQIYSRVMQQSGGRAGILNLGALESALAQPRMTFAGVDLYPTVVEKAAALGYSIISNHPFTDGNKRMGHIAMELFLALNGYTLQATEDEQFDIITQIASGELRREGLIEWLRVRAHQ